MVNPVPPFGEQHRSIPESRCLRLSGPMLRSLPVYPDSGKFSSPHSTSAMRRTGALPMAKTKGGNASGRRLQVDYMTRTERVKAAVNGAEVDRIPICFWHH